MVFKKYSKMILNVLWFESCDQRFEKLFIVIYGMQLTNF